MKSGIYKLVDTEADKVFVGTKQEIYQYMLNEEDYDGILAAESIRVYAWLREHGQVKSSRYQVTRLTTV